jgi:hypothetical protein
MNSAPPMADELLALLRPRSGRPQPATPHGWLYEGMLLFAVMFVARPVVALVGRQKFPEGRGVQLMMFRAKCMTGDGANPPKMRVAGPTHGLRGHRPRTPGVPRTTRLLFRKSNRIASSRRLERECQRNVEESQPVSVSAANTAAASNAAREFSMIGS